MVNFNKIHPSLFAKMKLFYLIQFFVKGCSISATARSKKVFFLQICSEIGSKMTSRYFLLNEGLKTAFFEIK